MIAEALFIRFARYAERYTSLPKAQIATFMGYVLTLVATMAERSVFMVDEAISSKNELRDEDSADERDSDDEADDEEKRKQRHMQLFYHPNGDAMARLRATGAFVFSVLSQCKKSREEREAAKKAKEENDEDDDDDEEQSRHCAFSRKELQQHSTSEDIQQLCNSNYLHLPSLQRVLDLRMQLQTISESLRAG